jgi:hypothetical protein
VASSYPSPHVIRPTSSPARRHSEARGLSSTPRDAFHGRRQPGDRARARARAARARGRARLPRLRSTHPRCGGARLLRAARHRARRVRVRAGPRRVQRVARGHASAVVPARERGRERGLLLHRRLAHQQGADSHHPRLAGGGGGQGHGPAAVGCLRRRADSRARGERHGRHRARCHGARQARVRRNPSRALHRLGPAHLEKRHLESRAAVGLQLRVCPGVHHSVPVADGPDGGHRPRRRPGPGGPAEGVQVPARNRQSAAGDQSRAVSFPGAIRVRVGVRQLVQRRRARSGSGRISGWICTSSPTTTISRASGSST